MIRWSVVIVGLAGCAKEAAQHADAAAPPADGAGDGASSAGCPQGAAYPDGCPGAPTGAPPLPTQLDGEHARPPWNVAGVDYAVGYPAGTALADPAGITMAGVTVSAANHLVSVTGDHIVVSGYDFSLDGGWSVEIDGAGDVLQNSKLVVGANGNGPIYVTPSAADATIQDNLIDGQGSGVGAGTQILIGLNGAGTTTLRYNLFRDAWGQNIVASSEVGGETWVIEYNVIANAGEGFDMGAHGDWIQTYNPPNKDTATFSCSYNLFVQTIPIAQGRTQGISAFSANSGASSGGVHTESFDHDTFATTAGSYVNFAIILDTTRVIETGVIDTNYFDQSGIGTANGGGGNWDFVGNYNGASGGPYHGATTVSANIDMVTGAPL